MNEHGAHKNNDEIKTDNDLKNGNEASNKNVSMNECEANKNDDVKKTVNDPRSEKEARGDNEDEGMTWNVLENENVTREGDPLKMMLCTKRVKPEC